MDEETIIRVSLEELATMQSQTDWARLDAMTEEKLEQNALDDPDNQFLINEFWENANVVFLKYDVTIRR